MYLVYAALIGIIIFAIHRFQRRKFIRQQQKHEEEREKLEFLNKLQKEKFEEEQKQLTYLHQLELERHENEIIRLRNEKLESEIQLKNTELASTTLNLIQKNSILEDIRQTITLALKSGQKDQNTTVFGRLINLIDYSFNIDRDWDEFKMYFEGVHKDFFIKLKKEYPELSSGELRLCALIRLSLNLKETATLLNITPDSVKTARHRLRKKLNVPEESNLTDYLMTV
jgi:DNA-binding CsgD family transcriptional regulator